MSSPELPEQYYVVEAEYFAVLSNFEEVFKKYHEAILFSPIVKDNEENLKIIYHGLKTLHESFDNITEAFQVLCETKGILVS